MTTASFVTVAARPSLHGKAVQKKAPSDAFFAASNFDLLTQVLYEFIFACVPAYSGVCLQLVWRRKSPSVLVWQHTCYTYQTQARSVPDWNVNLI